VPEPAKITVLTSAQLAPVRKAMADKYRNSSTAVVGYKYSEEGGAKGFEDVVRKALKDAIAKVASKNNPRFLIYAPAKEWMDASGKATTGFDITAQILKEDEYSAIRNLVTVVKENVPANGLIHEVVHIDWVSASKL